MTARLSCSSAEYGIRFRGIVDSQTDVGDDDPDAGGFAAAATKRVKAATKRQFQTIASTVVSKKRQKMDDMGSLVNASAGKFRKIASDSNLGRHLTSRVNKREQKWHRTVLSEATCVCKKRVRNLSNDRAFDLRKPRFMCRHKAVAPYITFVY